MFDAFTAIGSESSSVNLDWERENDYFDSAEYAHRKDQEEWERREQEDALESDRVWRAQQEENGSRFYEEGD